MQVCRFLCVVFTLGSTDCDDVLLYVGLLVNTLSMETLHKVLDITLVCWIEIIGHM